MAEVYKILGQSAPSATTATDVYTVGASTEAIVSTITVCERGGATATFRIAFLIGGGTVATTDYIAYDHIIGANETITFTIGAGMATTDQVEVYASTADLTFQVFGMELTP
jgi:hypothetical protein